MNHIPADARSTELDVSELAKLGQALYERSIRDEIEAKFDRQFLAIHVESGDCTVARSTGDAIRAMRKIHPLGGLFLRKIGDEPEYGLSARLLAGASADGRRK